VRHLSSVMLAVVGVIHLLPLSGVLGPAQIESLYGLAFADPNAVILMRHRAVLFGIVGLFLVYATFRPAFQAAAFAGGVVSVGSFLWLAGASGGYNAALSRVVLVDWVALCLLVAGIAGKVYMRSRIPGTRGRPLDAPETS
jgi:hypothetical protein